MHTSEISASKADEPRLVDTGRGLSVLYKNQWLYSRYNPPRTAEQLAASAVLHSGSLYLVCSPGLGYGLASLASRLPPDSLILCVETDQALMRLCIDHTEELRARFKNIRLLRSSDPAAIWRYASRLGAFKRVIRLNLSHGHELDTDGYDAIHAYLARQLATESRNRLAAMRRGRLWLKNSLANLERFDWTDLSPPPADNRPVLVVGAGASLEASLPWIRAKAAGWHILACDTALGPLEAAGIRADSVVCLEGQIHNVADFLALDGRSIHLFVDLSAHPASLSNVRGPKSLILSQWADNRFLERIQASGLPFIAAPALGSVGVLALYLGWHCFVGDLYIAGLDFCFPAGQTHGPHSPVALYEELRQSRLYQRAYSWRTSFQSAATGRIRHTAVLDMYADLAKELLGGWQAEAGGRRCLDLRPDWTADLGIELATADSLGAVPLAAEAQTPPVVATPPVALRPPTAAHGEYGRLAADFLAAEARAIDRLRHQLRTTDTERAALAKTVEDLDYLYAHFPDPQRVAGLELDALKRLALEAEYWVQRFRSSSSRSRKTAMNAS